MRFILFFLLNLMIFRPKAYKKGLRLLLPVRDESLNFRGTTLIDICPCGRVSAFQYLPGAAITFVELGSGQGQNIAKFLAVRQDIMYLE